MEKEIILIKDVDGLGKQGDIMRVAPGFARNFLFPKALAAPATPKAVKMLELESKRREAEQKKAGEKLREQAGKLSRVSCTISVMAGEDGKLFGSVSAQDIADSLTQAGFEIDKKQVVLPEPLKELGVFPVSVTLAPGITAAVKVWVVEK